MKVIGIREVNFTTPDGKQISGYSLFCSYPISGNGQGVAVDRVFLSDKKIAACCYLPELDDEINVHYNRWGKVETVAPLGQ